MLHARIKPHSPKHGRVTRRLTFGGKVFIEGHSLERGSIWYVVSDAVGAALRAIRNDLDKRIFDVVTAEQAVAIDAQEGRSPNATAMATRVSDAEIYDRALRRSETVPTPGADLVWRYDPDAESVPDLPPGYIDGLVGNTLISQAVVQSQSPLASSSSKDASSAEDAIWAAVEREHNASRSAVAARDVREVAEAQKPDQDDGGDSGHEAPLPETPPSADTGTPSSTRRRRADKL